MDKEIDVEVDGVISIDLEAVKKLIAITGPIKINGTEVTVASDNIYDFIQSDNNDNLLTELFSGLLTSLTNIQHDKYLDISKALFDSLEQKHIQVFLHTVTSQKSLGILNWNGAVNLGMCSDNCYSDYVGVVEADLGRDKGNLSLERSMTLESTLKDDSISRALRIDLKNNGDNPYTIYVRVIAPEGSEFTRVEKFKGEDLSARINPDIETIKDRTEAGVYLVVEPKSSATLVYRWDSRVELNFGLRGRYNLVWRKQSGTQTNPIFVNIKTPLLTSGQAESYNTTLSRDFNTHLSW